MTQNVVDILILILLLFISSFFSATETALTTVNKIRLQAMAEDGNAKAKRALNVVSHRGKMLSTILIGNNIANISASSYTTIVVTRLFGSMAVGIATGVLTILVLIFGEITPKTFAAANAEAMTLTVAPIIQGLMFLLTPVIFIVDFLSGGILRLLRVDPDARTQMTETELRTLVDVSNKDGVIENDERDMIKNVVDLSDTYAREIMIPRIDMTCVPLDADYDSLIEVFRKYRFTRLPVYDEKIENIVGIINIKNLLLWNAENFSVKKVMTQPYFTYETKNVSDLLDEMRLNSLSLVIILDEYGAASGMITLEDVLEEIVGDIQDEYKGRDEEEITEIISGKEYSCLGVTTLDDINKTIGTDLSSEDYDTIGGYIIEHSEDNLPKVGEYVLLEDKTKLIVESVRKNRIIRVHIYLPDIDENDVEDTPA